MDGASSEGVGDTPEAEEVIEARNQTLTGWSACTKTSATLQRVAEEGGAEAGERGSSVLRFAGKGVFGLPA